jgi:hypothetical protein
MNFALLVANLADIHQVPHTMPVHTFTPSVFQRMFSRLFSWQHIH